MPNTIDSLRIEIESDSQNASNGIENLVGSLEKLQKQIGGIQTSNLSKVSKDLSTFASDVKKIPKIDNRSFGSLVTAINKLSSIDTSGVTNAAGAINSIIAPINSLSNINFKDTGISAFLNSLTKLSGKAQEVQNIDFGTLGQKVAQMTSALAGTEGISQSVIQFTNAIGRLASTGQSANIAAAALEPLGKSLVKLFKDMTGVGTMSQDTIKFTTAIGSLANSGKNISVVSAGLNDLGINLKKFFQTMSTAPSVNRSIVEMTKALAQLSSSSTRISKATSGLANVGNSVRNAFSNFNSSTMSTTKSAWSLAAAFGKFYATYWLVLRAIRGVASWVKLASSLTEVQNVVDVSFGKMNTKVEEFAQDSIKQLGMSELSVKQYASRFQAMGNAMGISAKQVGDANKFLNGVTKGYDSNNITKPYVELSDSLADVSLNLTKLTADISSFYDVDQSDVAKALQSGIYGGQTRSLRQFGLDLTNATLSEWALNNGMNANIKTMTQAEKTMLRYQYVMANMKNVAGDFERTSDSWANQVRILKQQFEQLGIIVGKTIISAFKPFLRALNTVLGNVITFAQSIANALGKIFGWTLEIQGGAVDDSLSDAYDDASDSLGGVGDSAKDAADGTKKANDAAEEYKKTLLGFDKINKLAEQNDSSDSGSGSGKGSGSGSGGTGSVAEASLVQAGETIFSKFESSINNFYQLGTSIRDALMKAMDDIDWDSIYEKARGFGVGLADFLNGLFANNNSGRNIFQSLGATIAGAINTALNVQDAFSKEFNFTQFGYAIGSGINEFLEKLDWEIALSGAKSWGAGIGRALSSFLKETDFEEVGSAIAKQLNIAINFAFSLITNIDATSVGNAISDSINGFFKTFDGSKFASAMNTFVDKMRTALTTAIKGIEWKKVVSSAFDFIKTLDVDTIILSILALDYKFKGGIVDSLFKSIRDSISTSAASEVAKEGGGSLGIINPLTITIGVIGVIAWKGYQSWKLENELTDEDIKSAFGLPTDKMKEVWQKDLEDAKTKTFLGLKNRRGQMEDNSSAFVEWWTQTLPSEITKSVKVSIEYVKGNIQDLKDWVKNLKDNIVSGASLVIDFVATLTGWNKDKSFPDNIGGMIANLVSANPVGKWVSDKIGSFVASLTGKDTSEAAKGTFSGKLGAFTANITKKKVDSKISSGTLGSFTAKIKAFADKISSSKKTLSGFTAKISHVKVSGQQEGTWRADGGVFQGGKWKPIQKFAGGGSPGAGQLFIARESGPELVSRLNGHTAVMNNDQIVSSVASGVASAVASVMGGMMSQGTEVNVTLQGDAGRVFDIVKAENNRRVRATRVAQLLV